jgi:hypothetical protein
VTVQPLFKYILLACHCQGPGVDIFHELRMLASQFGFKTSWHEPANDSESPSQCCGSLTASGLARRVAAAVTGSASHTTFIMPGHATASASGITDMIDHIRTEKCSSAFDTDSHRFVIKPTDWRSNVNPFSQVQLPLLQRLG